MLFYTTAYNPKLRRYLGRTKWLLEKSIHNITNFDYPSNSRRCTCKKPWGNNIICWLLQGLWLHMQREDGANTTRLWTTKRNCRSHTLWIVQWKKNALRVSVAERENISPIILAHMVTIWICTRLQRVIAAENSTACEDHESTRRTGTNNVILLPENVNRMMALWIRFTPTVFTSPLLSISVLETFLASQEFSGPRVIR